MPPLPIFCLPTSNCGFINTINNPPAFNKSSGFSIIFNTDTKLTSQTKMSMGGIKPSFKFLASVFSSIYDFFIISYLVV